MITFKIRARRRGAHIEATIWSGNQPGSRALNGTLVFHPDEWAAFRHQLQDDLPPNNIVIEDEPCPDL